MKKFIILFILTRLLKYLNKDYVLQFETTQHTNITVEDFLKKKGFTNRDNGWKCKGFVYVRILNDCIELKTVSEYQDKSIYISMKEYSITNYLTYLNKLLK